MGQSIVGTPTLVPAVFVLVGPTFALIGLVPRPSVAPGGALGLGFVIGMFGQVLDLARWIRDISPFQHVPPYPATGLHHFPSRGSSRSRP